jgi:hypothetical protein
MKLANRYQTITNRSSFEDVLSQSIWQLVKRWGIFLQQASIRAGQRQTPNDVFA